MARGAFGGSTEWLVVFCLRGWMCGVFIYCVLMLRGDMFCIMYVTLHGVASPEELTRASSDLSLCVPGMLRERRANIGWSCGEYQSYAVFRAATIARNQRYHWQWFSPVLRSCAVSLPTIDDDTPSMTASDGGDSRVKPQPCSVGVRDAVGWASVSKYRCRRSAHPSAEQSGWVRPDLCPLEQN